MTFHVLGQLNCGKDICEVIYASCFMWDNLGCIHYVYNRGGQMILRGDLNFFGKEQGGMSRFFITGRGGANFFL